MPRHHPTVFYDSTNPDAIRAGALAAVYVNASGSFAWTQRQVNRMAGVFGISESSDPEWMKYGRCVADEPGAANPQGVVNCLRARRSFGHSDGMVYCDRSDWPDIEEACIANDEHPLWWIAAPGLSLAEARALRSEHQGERPVAVQNHWGQETDSSVVLGELHFVNPHHFRATG